MDGQSAIGFKPNNPGKVEPGQTFLLGAIRHNNLPIQGMSPVQHFLHSSLWLQFLNLFPNDQGEEYPFVNEETSNTLATTILYRKGGAYVKTEAQRGTVHARHTSALTAGLRISNSTESGPVT